VGKGWGKQGDVFSASEGGDAVNPKQDDDRMSLNDAVKHVMKATGRSRRQAEQCVLQALKAGKVRAWGEVHVADPLTGEEENHGVHPIPAEVFQRIPSEH
jgi:hypothetical protein